MANHPTQTVAVDRVSNNGNPIADQTRQGKQIIVPAGNPGDVLKVRLIDEGGYYRAEVVDPTTGNSTSRPRANPSTPAKDSPDLTDIAEKYCGDQALPVETRHSSSDLKPNEYPGSKKRKTIATRHD